MRSVRIAIGTALAVSGLAGWLSSCGGDDSGAAPGADASTPDTGATDATMVEAASNDASGPGDAGTTTDAGACAPPSDSTKAALCLTLSPESVQFLPSVPGFDGKGVLLVAIQATAMPDGGPTVVAPVVLPDLDAGDAGLLDLSQPLPTVRFDGVPATTVYPQVLFIDDPGAGLKTPVPGWWLGNYDFTNGLQGAPLKPVTLQAGQSATLSIDLRALRGLVLQVRAAVPPAGNGQGPLQVIVIDGNNVASDSGTRAWGYGSTPCIDCVADGGGKVLAFFVGQGPYYTVPVLDDFGLGGSFPPGAMTSLDPDAGLTVPAANQFSAGNAYVYSQSVQLNYVAPPPDGGIDEASCP
jgi:hypothetical protein